MRVSVSVKYIYGIKRTLLSKATYNKYVCQKKVQQYIAVGTVRKSAKILSVSARTYEHTRSAYSFLKHFCRICR